MIIELTRGGYFSSTLAEGNKNLLRELTYVGELPVFGNASEAGMTRKLLSLEKDNRK